MSSFMKLSEWSGEESSGKGSLRSKSEAKIINYSEDVSRFNLFNESSEEEIKMRDWSTNQRAK